MAVTVVIWSLCGTLHRLGSVSGFSGLVLGSGTGEVRAEDFEYFCGGDVVVGADADDADGELIVVGESVGLGASEESRVFRTAVLVAISCCVLAVQVLVVGLAWGFVAES